MTDNEMRIAIAEVCGWRHEYDTKNLRSVWISPKSGYAYNALEDMCPDYLNDLNAMAKAEKMLPIELDGVFAEQLAAVLGIDLHVGTFEDIKILLKSTARQHAEAFLKTIGKWKD